MAIFLANMPFAGQLDIERDPGYVESDFGGVVNQYDSAGASLISFVVTLKTDSYQQVVSASIFILGSGVSEETTLEIDGTTYIGVFTGETESQHIGNLHTLKAPFIGREQ